VNSSPSHAHHRYVINFGERSEEECRREWPELMGIVERKVKPERLKNNRESYRRFWWQYAEKRGELAMAISALDKVIVAGAAATSHLSFPILNATQVFSHKLIVFPISQYTWFACIKSRSHGCFAQAFSSTLGDGLTYNPSDCFETFPFPTALLNSAANDPAHSATRQTLESIGERYHQFRAELMLANNEGLTSTYNRFHDPAETSSGLMELRRLHGEMDQAVLEAYGWSDVLQVGPGNSPCGFGLDYIDLEDDAQLSDELQERIDSGDLFFWEADEALDFQGQLRVTGAVKASRRLAWRYRWPDAVRDDVLAQLLALNAERYAEEMAQGLHGKTGKKPATNSAIDGKRRGRPAKAAESSDTGQIGLAL
jgi:hypothetical protein